MKVLFIAQGRKVGDQLGYEMAFSRASCGIGSGSADSEVRVIPWLGVVEARGWKSLWKEIMEANEELKPEIVFFQRFHSGETESPIGCIRELRKASNRPLIFADIGDLFQPYRFRSWVRPFPMAIVDLAREADCFFVTAMGGQAQWLRAHGARRIELLPLAFSNDSFPDWQKPVGGNPDFDVVMLAGITIQRRHPINTLTHIRYRYDAAMCLRKRYGQRFGLFGGGWEKIGIRSNGPVPFGDQVRLFKRAIICVDARPPCVEEYYASNRPFYIAGAGSTLVQYYMPMLGNLLREGRDTHFVRCSEDLIKVCDSLLERNPVELREQGRDTQRFVQSHHTIDKRVDTILSVAESLRDSHVQIRRWHFV